MLYYPQLTTGAVSQFPVTRSTNMRTVANQLAERLHDPDGRHRRAEGAVAASIFEPHRRRTVLHRKPVRSLRRSTEHVHLLRSHRQSVDVERGLDASGVDGRSAVAGNWRSGGSAGRQRRRCNSRTLRKRRNRSFRTQADQVRFVYCYSVYVRSAVPATIQLVVAATGQTSLTAGNHRRFVDASDDIGQPLGSTGWHLASECNCRQACKWTRSALKWKHSPERDCIRRRSTWAASIRARGFLPTYSRSRRPRPTRTPVRSA